MWGRKISPSKIAAVINAKIENPDISLREVWEKAGVHYSTAKYLIEEANIQELPSKSDVVMELVEANTWIINEWKRKLHEFIKNTTIDSWRDAKDVSTIVNESLNQNRLLEWKSTENIAITEISIL